MLLMNAWYVACTPHEIDDKPATKEFMRWEPEIQNTVRPQGPNGTTTGTDGQKTTRNYPSRSLTPYRQRAKPQFHGTTTGTLLYSTMRG